MLRNCRNYICQLFFCKPKMDDLSSIVPPPTVRGMTELNRESFKKNVNFPVILVNYKAIKKCQKSLKNLLCNIKMNRTNLKPPTEFDKEATTHKYIFLRPGVTEDLCSLDQLKTLKDLDVKLKFYNYEMEIGYDNYKHWDILRAILPEGDAIARGFANVGHILHVNLRDHHMPYKKLIGQVLLDKIPNAKSVIHKANTIDNEFRNFEVELLAGEDNYVTRVIEYGNKFEFDFSKVFWNSRLLNEHQRVADLAKMGDVVFDMFAGVGPFAIPIAKKGIQVYANDLNPNSFKWLEHNTKLNKANLKFFNKDGRDFIKKEFKNTFIEQPEVCYHILMNLPAKAVEFLDVFRGLINQEEIKRANSFKMKTNIHIHCHCFAPSQNGEVLIKELIKKHMQHDLPQDGNIIFVRNVAPQKDMFCASFKLPGDVLFNRENDVNIEPECKRLKTN